AGADAHRVVEREDEDLSVADLACLGGGDDRLNGPLDDVDGDGHLDLDLGQETDGVFRATVDFRVPLLTPVAFDFGDGQALYADGGQRFAHLVELERLDNCHHDFHKVSPFAGCGSPALHVTFRE